jgi:hypothetical protein
MSYDEKAKARTAVRWGDRTLLGNHLVYVGPASGGPACPERAAYEAEIAHSDAENEALRAEVQRLKGVIQRVRDEIPPFWSSENRSLVVARISELLATEAL